MLPAVGTCTYNGFDFGVTARSKVSSRFLYDDADRTVIGVVHTISISTYISEATVGAGCDTEVATARIQLSKAGQALSFALKGFGNFTVNVSGVRDVSWGPKPRIMRLEPMGSRGMWALEWVCEVTVPECSGALYAFGIMAFNFEETFSFDARRYTTRQITGYLEIPMTRVSGGRTLSDIADSYRERIRFPIPVGFRRVNEVYRVSADKRRIEFAYTDQELPGQGMPDGCVEANGRVRVSSANEGLASYSVTISASYLVAKSRPRSDALAAFYALCFDRVNTAIRNVGAQNVVAVNFASEEGVYLDAPFMSFDFTYLVHNSTIDRVFRDTGTWREVPNTNAQRWAISIGDVMGPRAAAGLRLLPGEDIIIDLCGQVNRGASLQGVMGSPREQPVELRAGTPHGLLDYQMELRTTQTPNVSYHTKLPTSSGSGGVSNPGSAYGPASTENFVPLTSGTDPLPPSEAKTVVNPNDKALQVVPQQRGVDEFEIVLSGYSVTTWKPLPMPKMMRFPGGIITIVPWKKHTYTQRFLGLIGGSTPVYLTQWYQTYRVCLAKGRGFRAPVFSTSISAARDRGMIQNEFGNWGRTPTVDLTGVFGDG